MPTSLCEDAVVPRIRAYFGTRWREVDGPGELNFRAVTRRYPPTISIRITGDGPGECVVSIWTSHWRHRSGLIINAQLAWRRKLGLANLLNGPVSAIPNWTQAPR